MNSEKTFQCAQPYISHHKIDTLANQLISYEVSQCEVNLMKISIPQETTQIAF